MAVFLVQHGKSLSKELDPEQGLSPEGISDSEKPVLKFQNGGIVCLDEGPEGKGWVIKWTLMPEIG